MTLINPPHAPGIEFIFLGTGTSGSLPNVGCITAGPDDGEPCRTCLSTLTPEGKKNVRRNTSAVMRIDGKDGRKRTIVIDVGKNFQAAAIEWFPKYGLRRIDAVLITHAHADAMNGLDDLRGWTLGWAAQGAIQKFIDVYVSQATFVEVERSFPYMVSHEFRSGGGDIPQFKWHIFEDGVPVEIGDSGIEFTPFIVHHGRLFSSKPLPAFAPTPNTPSTPYMQPSVPSTPLLSAGFSAANLQSLSLTPSGPALTFTPSSSPPKRRDSPESEPAKPQPYLCFGFKIQESVIYLSDVSYIPDSSWEVIKKPTINGKTSPPYGAVIMDCLRPVAHISHFGIQEAVDHARLIGGTRTYLTGFGHEISHDEYITIGEVAGGKEVDLESVTPGEHECITRLNPGKNVWLRPAHDGLQLFISPDGAVKDSTYDSA